MFCGLLVWLRCADHPDFAVEFFRKQGGAQIVISHMGGQDDGTLRGAELIEPFGANDLIGEFLLAQLVDRSFGNRPRIIMEGAKDTQIIHRPR